MYLYVSRGPRNRRRGTGGFTLPEVVIAGAILAIFVAGSVATMAQINRWASSARLRTLALALAQQKSDEVLTTPWQTRGARPAAIAAGTNTESALPLNNDSFNSAAGLSSAFTALDTPVTATRTTQITDVSARTVRSVVTVSFTYRNRPHSVRLTTLRATDDI
jgi:prepilin-type N-terminal cleavage/methylation domain-containing protein